MNCISHQTIASVSLFFPGVQEIQIQQFYKKRTNIFKQKKKVFIYIFLFCPNAVGECYKIFQATNRIFPTYYTKYIFILFSIW